MPAAVLYRAKSPSLRQLYCFCWQLDEGSRLKAHDALVKSGIVASHNLAYADLHR
jgi:hypothetical protein